MCLFQVMCLSVWLLFSIPPKVPHLCNALISTGPPFALYIGCCMLRSTVSVSDNHLVLSNIFRHLRASHIKSGTCYISTHDVPINTQMCEYGTLMSSMKYLAGLDLLWIGNLNIVEYFITLPIFVSLPHCPCSHCPPVSSILSSTLPIQLYMITTNVHCCYVQEWGGLRH